MNNTANETVKFIEKHNAETEDNTNLDEMIATLAMDSADCWF